MTIKDRAVRVISQLPDNATLVDIMSELYVQVRIDEGLRQLDEGRGIDHSEVEKRLAKWLE